MGTGELRAAVDAGPLIHLAEIGCLRFLNGFDILHVPDAVWAEAVLQGCVSQTELSNLKNILRHSLSGSELEQFVKEENLTNLHAGEKECLLVCLRNGIPILLTDDMAVRAAARRVHIIPVGSLGIVVSACRRGEITLREAERCISDLYDISSLFVTRAIAELAIEQIRSSAK